MQAKANATRRATERAARQGLHRRPRRRQPHAGAIERARRLRPCQRARPAQSAPLSDLALDRAGIGDGRGYSGARPRQPDRRSQGRRQAALPRALHPRRNLQGAPRRQRRGAQPFADRGAVHGDAGKAAAAAAQCRLPRARRAAVRNPQKRRRRHRPDDPDAEPRQGSGQKARQRRRGGADARPRRFRGRPVAAQRGVPRLLHRDQCAPAARRHHHRRPDQFHDPGRGDHLERRHAARLGAAVGAVAQDARWQSGEPRR